MSDDPRVLAALPFVRTLARRLVRGHPHVDLDDLVQSGVLGLMTTVPEYDPSSGRTFEQFAYLRVRGAMVDDLRRGAWPRGVRLRWRAIKRASNALVASGLAPTEDAIAARLAWPVEDVASLLLHIDRLRDLQTRPPDGRSWIAPVAAVTAARSGARPLPSDSRTPEQILRQRERSASIRAAFARLDSRERRILQLCYVEERSIPEIATALGVSPTRIFQLKRRALDRLALQLAPLRAAA